MKVRALRLDVGAKYRVRRLFKRTGVRVVLVCCMVALIAGAIAAHVVMPASASTQYQPQGTPTTSGTEYGADDAAVGQAVKAAGWPQSENNWCGIANISAIAQYLNDNVSQATMANYLHSTSSESEWGTPSQIGGLPPFVADIARDGGTDPRSIATGLANATGGHYHVVVGYRGAWNATQHLAADIERSKQPISVTIAHGLHSVLISDVYATGDPTTDPSSITGLVAWDPGVGSPWGGYLQTQRQVISLQDWLTNADFWGEPYDANYYGSIPYDPDPAIGPYTYDPQNGDYADLWIGHYVYMRPDAAGDPSNSVNADWAFDQNDHLIKGINGEVPSGYTGPTIPQVNKITMSDASITAPALWSEAEYAAASGGPKAVLAWTGTDSAHHLNVSESSDGMTYSNKITPNETTSMSPTVLVVPNTTTVVLGWRGTDSAGHLNVLYDVYGAKLKFTLNETSPYPPSIAYFNNQLWIAWTGADSGHSMNVAAITIQNGHLSEGKKTTLWSNHSGAGPTLVPDVADSQLLLTWQNYSNYGPRWLEFAQSPDGSAWTLGTQSSQTSIATPDLMVINNAPSGMTPYFWSWTGTDRSGMMNIMQTSSLSNWSVPATTFSDTTATTPVIGYVGGYNGHTHEILLLWTGLDAAHHMNVAALAV